jgi:predicted nucleotide-binding protein with TIR-like domain
VVQRRVFVSATNDQSLDDRRRAIKTAIVAKLQPHKLAPQSFFEAGIAENMAWNFDNVDRVMRKCIGAIVIGFPRWAAATQQFIGEYNHYEGAVALSYRLPVMLLAERGVENRGIVWSGAGRPITYIPADATPAWLESQDFQRRFEAWVRDVEYRRDVFLGYCSQNQGTAAIIENRLTRSGATVLNYQMDFRAGVSILNEIEAAAARCSCGIFLFGNNDPLEGMDGGAAPRDNVVFEAGYFMNAKGPERCLIIREDKAKMPADLGGAIYLQLKNSEVAAIESGLERFLAENL